MFAMLFGAGNILYPLILGRDIGTQIWFGLAGFCITAVFVPLIGLVAVMLCDGDYEKFLEKMGHLPGFVTALFCMMLLGPLVFTPRCITISHASINMYLPNFSLFHYSIFSSILIFIFTIKHNRVLDLLGYVLGPLKFLLLFTAIIAGFLYPQPFLDFSMTSFEGFHTGLMSGFWTGDLLATIFFSGLIYSGLKKSMDNPTNYKELALLGLKAGSIGAILLGLVYTGFCIIAAFNGAEIQGLADNQIFSNLIPMLLGPIGGLLANITVAIACLTTAIALTTVVSGFFQHNIFKDRIGYIGSLIITIVSTAFMSNLGFAGIMNFAVPIIFTIYPALLALAITSTLQVLFGFTWVRLPVIMTLVVTILVNHWQQATTFIAAYIK